MTVVISLGTRLDVCMRIRLEIGILCNRQQPGSVESTFFDHSEFEAMKSLSGLEAAQTNFVLKSR